MTGALLLIVAATFLLALASMSLIRPVLMRLGAIDIPNHRSSHDAPVVRGAGIALTFALLVATVLATFFGGDFPGSSLLSVCLAMSFLAAAVGAVEDVRGMLAKYRFLLQLLIGMFGTLGLVMLTSASWWWVPLGALATATYINAANFMDGINGISGLHGFVAGGTYSLIGYLTGSPWLTVGGLLIAVVFASFLPWNVLGGRMFLGDAGSYLLGCSIVALAIAAFLAGIHPVALFGPLAIYAVDVASTLLRRVLAGENWMEAHRSHIYQRLTDTFRSHIHVSVLVNLLGAGTGLAGLFALNWSTAGTMTAAVLIACLVIGYMLSPQLAAGLVLRKSSTRKRIQEEDR